MKSVFLYGPFASLHSASPKPGLQVAKMGQVFQADTAKGRIGAALAALTQQHQQSGRGKHEDRLDQVDRHGNGRGAREGGHQETKEAGKGTEEAIHAATQGQKKATWSSEVDAPAAGDQRQEVAAIKRDVRTICGWVCGVCAWQFRVAPGIHDQGTPGALSETRLNDDQALVCTRLWLSGPSLCAIKKT